MQTKYSAVCSDISQTDKLAEKFSTVIKDKGAFVCLYGDIGAGKTAFSKCLCNHLNVKEKVTSPSFVILNEYHSGLLPIYHFDLYRLETEGTKTILDELEEYSQGKILTLVEWAQFSDNQLPFDRIEIKIDYIDDNTRVFNFFAFGEQNETILKELAS